MPDLTNLDSQDQADFIRDDAEPTLRLRNSSTGSGLHAEGLAATSNASVDRLDVGGIILDANATITLLNIAGASRASGAAIALKGDAFVSVASIDFAAGSDWEANGGLGAIRVTRTDGTFGWIPVLNDDALESVAVPA